MVAINACRDRMSNHPGLKNEDIIRHKNRNRQVGELGNLGQRGVVVKVRGKLWAGILPEPHFAWFTMRPKDSHQGSIFCSRDLGFGPMFSAKKRLDGGQNGSSFR